MPFEFIPDNIDFEVGYETTKMPDKKYVVNKNTDEYIAIVGKGFNCVPHGEFFNKVINATTDNMSPHDMEGAEITWKDAHNNGWAMMDMRLPNVVKKIQTDKKEFSLMKRIIALHGVDGTCSNTAIFGAIDFFCLNGQIRGNHDRVMRKNTAGLCMEKFASDLKKSQQDFNEHAKQMQRWANSSLMQVNVKDLLKDIVKDANAEKMYSLYRSEVTNRGDNLFALYSAFTNYATYADEQNGFKLRETGKDTQSVNMFKREISVAKWIETPQFRQLEAA